MTRQRHKAFTLAELLVVLGVLGVISTFNISKLITSQAKSQYKSAGKEAAAAISTAYFQLLNTQGFKSTVTGWDILTYINGTSEYTGMIDDYPTLSTQQCGSSGKKCVMLHNGGILFFSNDSFPGSTKQDALVIDFDPDGKVSDYKAIGFLLYTDGKLRTYANAQNNTCLGWVCPINATPVYDPDWFSWQ